jgi:hypothetical protein
MVTWDEFWKDSKLKSHDNGRMTWALVLDCINTIFATAEANTITLINEDN